MKKTILYALLILLFSSYIWASSTIHASVNALHLWMNTLVPSFLFPLILVRLLVPYQLLHPLLQPFNSLFIRLFNMNAYAIECVFTSLLLGFPGASILLEQRALACCFNTKQYQRLLYTSFMCSPNFILLSLHSVYTSTATYTLLFAQLLSVFTLLLCTRKTSLMMTPSIARPPFFTQLKTAVHESIDILCMILAFLIIVYVLIDTMSLCLPSVIKTPLKIISEFSSGAFYLSSLPLSTPTKIYITSAVLAYGGLCVHMQLISSLSSTHFKYTTFVKYRVFQIVLSLLFTHLLLLLM